MLTLMTALNHYDHHDGPGWWIIFPLLWFALIATVILLVARNRRRYWRPAARGEATLAERFAAGEIDADEYHQRLAILRGDRK